MFGTTFIDTQPVSYGSRVVILDIDENDMNHRDLKTGHHNCGWPEARTPLAGKTSNTLRGAFGGPGDAPKDVLTIGRVTSGSMSIGISLAKAPIDKAISCTREATEEATLETTFSPGADYLGYHPRPDNLLEKCWSITG
jgi:hypothetical protein